MPRGKVVEAPAARRYRPPERDRKHAAASGGDESAPPDGARHEQSVEDAIRSGYEEGLVRGSRDAEKELARQLAESHETLARSIGELHTLAERVLDLIRDEIIGLALQIASRIVRERIDGNEPVAARIADEMLARLGEGVRCRLRVHPEDRAGLLEHCTALAEEGLVEIVPDETVGRGGVVVDAAREQLDARLGTAFQALWEAVTEDR